jgi:hypothetical protein
LLNRGHTFVKFGALAIIRSSIVHTFKPTICTISLNLLTYTFRHIINHNFYIHVYKYTHTHTRLIIHKHIFIPGEKRTLMLYTGYSGHSDRAANLNMTERETFNYQNDYRTLIFHSILYSFSSKLFYFLYMMGNSGHTNAKQSLNSLRIHPRERRERNHW